MKTSEFVQLLEENPDYNLYFEYQKGKFVRADYHITEIKNVSYDTVDCGGLQNQWQETHVQLWETVKPDPNHLVDTSKALKIFRVVDKVRALLLDTEIKFEYGNDYFPTAILPVYELVKYGSNLIVHLIPTLTSCKAKDRASSPEEAQAACGGSPAKEKLHLQELTGSSCAPDGGCC